MQITTASYKPTTIPSFSNQIGLQASETPLPCRGCAVHCPDYPQCMGKPWRLAETLGRSQMVKFDRLPK